MMQEAAGRAAHSNRPSKMEATPTHNNNEDAGEAAPPRQNPPPKPPKEKLNSPLAAGRMRLTWKQSGWKPALRNGHDGRFIENIKTAVRL